MVQTLLRNLSSVSSKYCVIGSYFIGLESILLLSNCTNNKSVHVKTDLSNNSIQDPFFYDMIVIVEQQFLRRGSYLFIHSFEKSFFGQQIRHVQKMIRTQKSKIEKPQKKRTW